MYYTVIDENCHTCGHRHRHYGKAVDCLDKFLDFTPCNEEPFLVEVKKPIPLEDAGFIRAAYQKYGEDQPFQQFADKWLGMN